MCHIVYNDPIVIFGHRVVENLDTIYLGVLKAQHNYCMLRLGLIE